MERRDVLKTLGAAFSLPILEHLSPGEVLALGQEVHARLRSNVGGGRYIFKTLDPHQNQTVSLLADLIIPETDTPGAKAARVNEFIDLMLSEWFTAEERDRFLQGLARLDEESRAVCGKALADCDGGQQVELLEAQQAAATESREREQQRTGTPVAAARSAEGHFFDVIKWLTLFGYFTSEIGMRDELGYETFPVSYSGCAPFNRG
ncbi:MAG: gluconate 2-dehydrogenase subunit 3 family protein [Acidobacteriota bacterium]